jgi:signal transduction histidine kinase
MTDNYHHLFYINYSLNTNELVVGKYFIIHAVYSYICIGVGLYNLIIFSIKNSGFFSRQSILILVGSTVPVLVNVFATFKIISLTEYATPIAFSFAVICYMYAIFKFKFLSIAPIALQKIVDLISDGFIVVNEELSVVDYNQTFLNIFGTIFKVKRNTSITDILSSNPTVNVDGNEIIAVIDQIKKTGKSFVFEKQIKAHNFDRYFAVEITPIISKNNYIGTIILLKDITQSKKDLETIKENQSIIMEQERLASLGQLIGGIAHNLKTPIMSISGGIEALKDLVKEYEESIGDTSVTPEDHHEIAGEMMSWLDKMKPYCSYMSDVITTVKGQAVQLNTSSTYSFTLDELVKRVEVLMAHELKKYHCILRTDFRIDLNTQLKGDINNLVQILDNIVINAIQAYEGEKGDIDFILEKLDNNIVFTIKDYGKGIQPDIKERLFKEMVTTKGKNGTGLGLYMSYANIKGRFGGNMWVESEVGKGTAFYISIPNTDTYVDREAIG